MMTVFEIVSDPNRRQILTMLRERPHLVGELVAELDISQPGVSKHLRLLREAGLVIVRRDAQRRWYALCAEPLAELDAWLAPFRQLWDERFEQLDSYLKTIQDEQKANMEHDNT